MEAARVTQDSWKTCTLCLETLDGNEENPIAISRRCFHVFHRICIEESFKKHQHSCPNCKLEYLTVEELVPNPEYSKQYRKWEADPENYSFVKALQEEYDDGINPKDLAAEEVLKPKNLRGLQQQLKATNEDIKKFSREMDLQVEALTVDSTAEEIEKAMRESDKGHEARMDLIAEKLAKQDKDIIEVKDGFSKLNEQLDIVAVKTAHRKVTDAYVQNVSDLEEKIEQKIDALKSLSINKRDHTKIDLFRKFSIDVGRYKIFFKEAGSIEEQSIEEAKLKLLDVDKKLHAFIDSQPEAVKAVLRKPLPVPQPIVHEEPPLPPTPWKLKPIFKVMLIAASIFAIYAMVRSGRAKNTFQKPQLPKSNF